MDNELISNPGSEQNSGWQISLDLQKRSSEAALTATHKLIRVSLGEGSGVRTGEGWLARLETRVAQLVAKYPNETEAILQGAQEMNSRAVGL